MRIGVDISTWGNQRGIGRFTRELITALLKVETDHKYLFFVDSQTLKSYSLPKQITVVPVATDSSPKNGGLNGSMQHFTERRSGCRGNRRRGGEATRQRSWPRYLIAGNEESRQLESPGR